MLPFYPYVNCFINIYVCRSGAPIYEIPSNQPYTGENILEILFCPTINQDHICKECPTGITCSATFIVDLNKLRHPDDIKKDEFGKWNYSGSHCVQYLTWNDGGSFQFSKMEKNNSQPSGNVVQLRRVRCTHPSNPAFQRMLAFATGLYICMHACNIHLQCVGGSKKPPEKHYSVPTQKPLITL